MSIKLNFTVKTKNDNAKYFNNISKKSNIFNDNSFEIIDNNKILNNSGISLIYYNANKIILPECNINGCIKEILLYNINRNIDCLLYFNNECIILNLYNQYVRLINIQINDKYKWIVI